MNKKYTVFLSSTYDDLREERREVIQSLLELDCIPCSMETFPADDDEQFEFIKSVIDECDYYILIIAGRYGSIGKNGKSFTEMEYRYAKQRGIPILTFIHNDIGSISLDKSEKSELNRKKLESFIKYASKDKMAKYWNGKKDLAGKVSRAMISVIKRHPAVGWVRGNYAIDDTTIIKMQNLYEENLLYKEKEKNSKEKEKLKSGKDSVKIIFDILEEKYPEGLLRNEIIEFTWDELFKIYGQIFLEETRSYYGFDKMQKYVLYNNIVKIEDGEQIKLSEDSFNKIIIQFIALGLLEIVHPNHDNDYDMGQESKYKLTKDGEKYLIKLLAEKKS